jgi:hypothetical protein
VADATEVDVQPSPPDRPQALKSAHSSLETDAADFWLARGSIVVIAGLQLLFLSKGLSLGPRWLAPAFEMTMLIPLSAATAWTRSQHRAASAPHHLLAVGRYRSIIRVCALLLTASILAINLVEFVAVVRALLHGGKGPSGQSLLVDAMNLWFTNIVIFALFYWTIDQNSPAARGLNPNTVPDFLFPQMAGAGDNDPDWTPGFIDYLYVSFTNATAFSPTDTMPLSPRSKLLMALEAMVSLVTVGLVAARAVNILS